MPNFAEEAEMLEWAGICFGEDDTYRLGKSIKVSFAALVNEFFVRDLRLCQELSVCDSQVKS